MFVITGIIVILTTFYLAYFKWNHSYWKRRNFPYLEPITIPFGNTLNPLKYIEPVGVTVEGFYKEMKRRRWKHGGIYMMTTPTYIPIDLNYVKNILARDFHHFEDRGVYYNEEDDPLSAHLFAISGTKWRNLRMKLTPTFTPVKIKKMFQTLLECETNLLQKVEDQYQKKVPIDIKKAMECFTIDIIGSCAFGLDCNTFKDDNSPFRQYGIEVFNPDVLRVIVIVTYLCFPKLAKILRLRQIRKETGDFFMKVVKDTVEYREKNHVTREDFLQSLIELKNNEIEKEFCEHDGKSLTIEELAAQCFIFFVASFETSSTTMTFALYEMAINQDIQEKVREEIQTVLTKYVGNVCYDAIQDMKYLDQVIHETLRKYPPVPFVTRDCTKEYQIPNTSTIIEKGVRVVIPILGIHRDEEYYPDPERFDPERFNEVNSNSRPPYAFIPFGEGPKICIGIRFGLLQSKVGLISLLKKYKFDLNERTRKLIKFEPQSFVLTLEGGVWLDAEKL